MESVPALLFAMRVKGAKIWTDRGQLLYDAPRGVLGSADLETLRKHKTRIVEFLSRSRGTELDSPLGPRDPAEPVPLTPVQQYFFNRAVAVGGRSRRVPAVLCRLSGPLDRDALERAVNELVRRHETLRTRIVLRDGAPTQDVRAHREQLLERIDVTDGAPAAREAKAKLVIRELVNERIHVTTDPLFMARLLVLGEQDHVLLIAMEHMLFDALSMDILQRDLSALYARAAHGESIDLPHIAVQFADYAVWQMREGRINQHDAYWNERLAGARHLQVFADTMPNPVPKNARWRFRFDRPLTSALRAFSRQHKTTLRMSVLTAYVALLAQWCKTTDVVVRAPVIVRQHPELQHTVGPLGACPYLRVEVREDDSFLDLLTRVVGEFNSAFEHDDSGKLLAKLPRPPFAANPGFNFSSYDVRASLQPAFDWSRAGGAHGPRIESAHFAVEAPFREELVEHLEEPQLLMFDTSAELSGLLVYRADRAGLRTLKRFEQSFRFLAQRIVDSPLERLPRAPEC